MNRLIIKMGRIIKLQFKDGESKKKVIPHLTL